MLELRDLTAHYGKNEVVSGASIVLNAGEVVALIGANAAGKSTTMRLDRRPQEADARRGLV